MTASEPAGSTAEPVRVESYAGGRAEEAPRAVWVGDERVALVRVVETRLEESHPERLRRWRFVVETLEGERWVLTRDESTATWWLERPTR
ncbi:MAG: hypothetical protein V3R38_02810 [bacterium]|nr:hypothetical protein [bacterium]MDV2503831.1 hypothetical protein [bacterium]